jgi:hypothetical protein
MLHVSFDWSFLIGRAVTLVTMFVETFKTDVIIFIGDVIMCLTSDWLIIFQYQSVRLILKISEIKGKMSKLLINHEYRASTRTLLFKKLKKVSNTDRPYQNPVVNRVLVKCKQFFYDTQRVTHSQVRWVRFFWVVKQCIGVRFGKSTITMPVTLDGTDATKCSFNKCVL